MTKTGLSELNPVVERPVEWFQPAAYNPRKDLKPGDRQYEDLKKSIGHFGHVQIIVANKDGTVIGGHQTLKVLKDLGYKKARCVILDLPENEEKALNVALNRIEGEWDPGKLAELLVELDASTLGSDLTGFNEADIKELVDVPGKVKDMEDEIPPVPKNPITKVGDVWILGRHRIICGDSVESSDAQALLAGAKLDMLITDPPYCSGGFQESNRAQGSVGTDSKKYKRAGKIHNDTLSTRGYQILIKSVLANFQARMVYIFTDWRMWVNLFDVVESKGYGVRNMIVWDKGTPGMGRGWRAQHELLMFGAAATIDFDNHKAQGNVIQSQRTGNIHHTTEKPVDLLEKVLEVTPGQNIGDPFLGSGSTLIACENTGRTCFGVEMSPGYCDVVVERWEKSTGKKAVLEKQAEPKAKGGKKK
jgi:DNA modification methylase